MITPGVAFPVLVTERLYRRGELIILDLQTNEVMGVRRGYVRSGNVKTALQESGG